MLVQRDAPGNAEPDPGVSTQASDWSVARAPRSCSEASAVRKAARRPAGHEAPAGVVHFWPRFSPPLTLEGAVGAIGLVERVEFGHVLV